MYYVIVGIVCIGIGFAGGWLLCKKYGKKVSDAQAGLIDIAEKFKKEE